MRPIPNIYLALVTLALAWHTPGVSALQDSDGSVIDGFIARQARRERGEEYREARKVLVGDLNRDDVPETVVLYTIESQGGTNNYVQYVAVFARGNRGLIPVTHTEVGAKMRRSVEMASVEDNTIQLATLSYGPKDASCCPSVKGTTRYALVGRTLREQKHGTTRVPGKTHSPSTSTRIDSGKAYLSFSTARSHLVSSVRVGEPALASLFLQRQRRLSAACLRSFENDL